MEIRLFVQAFVAAAVLVSCAPVPNTEKLKKNLTGQRFFYKYTWGSGGEYRNVHAGDVKELTVKDVASSGKYAEITANVMLSRNPVGEKRSGKTRRVL